MYSHRVDIFHIAYYNRVIVIVTHYFVFYFFITRYTFFNKTFSDGAYF